MDQNIIESINGVDLANRRIIKTENNEIYIDREDPYGFWKVRYKTGSVPVGLGGYYTKPAYAIAAVNAYLEQKAKERPQIKYKKNAERT